MTTIFSKLWRLLTPAERRGAMVQLGLMLIGTLLETAGIGLMIPVIALMMLPDIGARYPVLEPVLAWLGHPSQQTLIIGAMLGLAALYLVKNLFLAFLAWRATRFVFGVQAQLSERLFAAYLAQPYTFHLQHNSAQLIHNVSAEVGVLTHSVLAPALLLVTEALTLLAIGGLTLMVEPMAVALVALLLGGASLGFHRITRAHLSRWGQLRSYHERQKMQHLLQGLGGIKEVTLAGRERDFLAQFHLHNVRGVRTQQALGTLQQLPRLWLELLVVTGLATVVLTMIAGGQAIVEIAPTVGFLAAAAYRLMPSVNRMLGAISALRFHRSTIDTLVGEVSLVAQRPKAASLTVPLTFVDGLRVTDVSYTYPGAPAPALHRVSIDIGKGESVGLIGPSGAGKSTLVDVLLGLLPATSGQVLVDGVDIQGNLSGWQDHIGYVPQSIYLTDDTLRRNVAFGLPDDEIDEVSVRRAITAAQLDEFVASVPDGLETFVGERGVRVSGGQRQRIGIARALYQDPPVLVLDEATSALDVEVERGVMDAVTALRGSKTLVIVAHRLTTVAHCDRLFRLEHGRIVAVGTPAELGHHRASSAHAQRLP
jgi:ABC-type multidrug transport system fused ATPase/permease subunit